MAGVLKNVLHAQTQVPVIAVSIDRREDLEVSPGGSTLAGAKPNLQRLIATGRTLGSGRQQRNLVRHPAPDLGLQARPAGGGKGRLRYPVGPVSLGLGYRYATGEDLALELTEAGSLLPDYSNHSVLVRAHWQF